MKLTNLHNSDVLAENKRLVSALRKAIGKGWGIEPPVHRKKKVDQNIGTKAAVHLQKLADSDRGLDSGSRSAGSTQYPSGMPANARHQKYFGIKPPGAPI